MDSQNYSSAHNKQMPTWLVLGFIVLPIIWIILSMYVIPPIIKNAYNNESITFLNNLISTSGRTNHAVDDYLKQWRSVSWGFLTFGALLLFPILLIRNRVWHRSLVDVRLQRIKLLSPLTINLIIVGLFFILVFYLYYFQPVGYIYFIAENYWAEYGTFSSYAIAFSLMTLALCKHRNLRKPGFILLALGAFFIAMEEIGWGQNIIRFSAPEFFVKHNYQQETNIHNMIYMPSHAAVGIVVFLWSIAFPLLENRSVGLHQFGHKLGIPIVPYHIWPYFFLAIFFLSFSPLIKSDEVAELFLGIALAVLCLSLLLSKENGTGIPHKISSIATAGLIIYIAILSSNYIYFFSMPDPVKSRLNYWAAITLPRAGMYSQAENVFNYINRHPEYVTSDTYIEQGRLYMKMRRYEKALEFLDIALAKQMQFRQQRPDDPGPIRKTAEILKLQNRHEEAMRTFQQAIEIDEVQLEKVNNNKTEITTRMSLVRTFLKMGECGAAKNHISKIRLLNPNKIILYQLERLLQDLECEQ